VKGKRKRKVKKSLQQNELFINFLVLLIGKTVIYKGCSRWPHAIDSITVSTAYNALISLKSHVMIF
jgi:hypothetical protein